MTESEVQRVLFTERGSHDLSPPLLFVDLLKVNNRILQFAKNVTCKVRAFKLSTQKWVWTQP